MDRSSLRRVETTSDSDKRQAFKNKLAEDIDKGPQAPASTPISHSIPVGSSVWHPDLGVCTVFSVDERTNSLVLDFPDRGKIEMALRQVQSSILLVGLDGEPIHRSGEAPPVLAPSAVENLKTFSPTNWGRTSPEALAETERRLASEQVHGEPTPMVNGILVGSTVWHPDLGPCTVFSIDKKANSVVLESGSLGKIELVLSQVESKLVPPNQDGGPAYVDKFSPPFVEPSLIDSSEAFSHTNWHRADQPTIYTEKKGLVKKVTAKTPVSGHLPIGSSVWHPDFGACTVLSIDPKANMIVLDFATFGSLDMVLSQVESKLLPIGWNAPSHVGKTPRTSRESKDLVVPATGTQRSITLPSVFKGWKPLEQFSYLTREKHLTTEEANEFIAALSGRFGISPGFEILWDEVLDKEKKAIFKQKLSDRLSKEPVVVPVPAVVNTTPQPLSELLSLSVTLPSVFKSLSASGQYTFLTKTKHLTPEEAKDVLAVIGDTAPRNPKVQFEILWDDGPAESGVRREFKEPEVKAKIQAASIVREALDLPQVFKTWKPVEQFQYLTSNKHLTSLAANNVIEAISRNAPCDFAIVWDELPETEKRVIYKKNLFKKVEESGLKNAIEPIKPVDRTPQPLSEVLSLSVTLPKIFRSLQASGQYAFLTKTKHLTPEEANDVIAIYRDTTPRNPKVRFEILWDDHEGLSEFGVRRVLKEPDVKVDVPKVREVLDLPQVFKTWKPVEQYQYLTGNKHLTSVAANNVIESVLYNFACEFDIIWDELPETKKRLAYKENLFKKVEAGLVVRPEPLSVSLPAAMTHVGVQRIMVDTKVAKKVTAPGPQRLSVTVPHEFKTWNASDQYTFFTKTKKLTPNEANDLISVYNGDRPHDSNMQYEFVWDTLSVGLDPTQVRRTMDPVEIEERETVSQLQKLSVTLPQVYKKWRPADQFSFLAHTKHLSNEEANDIMAFLRGESTHNPKTIFEIIWDDK